MLYLHPLTEQEKSGEPSGILEALINGEIKPDFSGSSSHIEEIATKLCIGGYPEPNRRTLPRARQWHRQYINAIIQRDVRDIAAIHDEAAMLRLMELLAYRTASLLNISNLSKELAIQRETASKYLNILERLFLVRQLPAWHRNQGKRLIKSPKVHIVDSGLAATLGRLEPDQWLTASDRFGDLLETFVVEQLAAQASWLDAELSFSHYRDKDRAEVDLVIERGMDVWGIEIKRASAVQGKDCTGLARLADQAGKQFRGGLLFYNGSHTIKLDVPGCHAVPLKTLWRKGS